MGRFSFAFALAGALSLAAGGAGAAADWVPIDPANEIYMDISGGTVVIELHPEAAPQTVARIKELVKAGFYNGLTFHRVISDFMAQGGDPLGTGEGGSDKPDIPAEFTFHSAAALSSVGKTSENQPIAISGAAVVLSDPEVMQFSKGGVRSWIPHCRGTVSMARRSEPNTANSQFFIMFSDSEASALDRNYTPWGHVVWGMETVDRIQRGEPPRNPTRIYRMRLGTDVPEKERLALEEAAPGSSVLVAAVDDLAKRERDRLNACDLEVPVRLAPGTQGTAQ